MQPPKWLERLLRVGSAPRSSVPDADDDLLRQMQLMRLVTIDAHGRRMRITVSDAAALRTWMEGRFAAPSVDSDAGRRAVNIARVRKSKRGDARHAVQPLFMRWFAAHADGLWVELTRRCGIVGVLSDRVHALGMPCPWRLLTVENWEPFVRLSYMPAEGAIVAVYASGAISAEALRALASIDPPPAAVVHFGDFDWTGLSIYRRIRAALPNAQLYVPDNIEDLFRTASNHELASTQTPLTLRPDDPPAVRFIADLIARWNAGLEQEIVRPPAL